MDILVTASGSASWSRPDGRAARVRCALGRGGIAEKSGEGDGITPLGAFPLRRVFYRPDRIERPATGLAVVALREHHGWCDDLADAAYNSLISLPFAASHEIMWRDDGLYDLVVETGYNDRPVIAGKGSAIFIHIARPQYAPTEGCVAMAREDLLEMLAGCGCGDRLVIAGSRK